MVVINNKRKQKLSVNVHTRMLMSVSQPSPVLDQHPEPSLSESILMTAAGRFYNAKPSLSPVTPNRPLHGANLVLIPQLIAAKTRVGSCPFLGVPPMKVRFSAVV